VAIALKAQGIGNYVGFPRMIVNFQVVVLDQLQPSTLSHIQILLGEEVLEALMIGIDVAFVPNQVVSPNLQNVQNSS
jgi:hypothetical protein